MGTNGKNMEEKYITYIFFTKLKMKGNNELWWSVRASKANKKVVLIRVNSYHMKKKSVLIRELSIPKKSPQAPVLNHYFIEESPGGSLGEETHRNNKGNCPFP